MAFFFVQCRPILHELAVTSGIARVETHELRTLSKTFRKQSRQSQRQKRARHVDVETSTRQCVQKLEPECAATSQSGPWTRKACSAMHAGTEHACIVPKLQEKEKRKKKKEKEKSSITEAAVVFPPQEPVRHTGRIAPHASANAGRQVAEPTASLTCFSAT